MDKRYNWTAWWTPGVRRFSHGPAVRPPHCFPLFASFSREAVVPTARAPRAKHHILGTESEGANWGQVSTHGMVTHSQRQGHRRGRELGRYTGSISSRFRTQLGLPWPLSWGQQGAHSHRRDESEFRMPLQSRDKRSRNHTFFLLVAFPVSWKKGYIVPSTGTTPHEAHSRVVSANTSHSYIFIHERESGRGYQRLGHGHSAPDSTGQRQASCWHLLSSVAPHFSNPLCAYSLLRPVLLTELFFSLLWDICGHPCSLLCSL